MIAYEVNYKEKKKVVAPHEVVELIYKNLSGIIMYFCFSLDGIINYFLL